MSFLHTSHGDLYPDDDPASRNSTETCFAASFRKPSARRKELGCPHNRLVFDDINDVHCVDCGKDFTG